jgi:outer membrane lipoprotein carrier protein
VNDRSLLRLLPGLALALLGLGLAACGGGDAERDTPALVPAAESPVAGEPGAVEGPAGVLDDAALDEPSGDAGVIAPGEAGAERSPSAGGGAASGQGSQSPAPPATRPEPQPGAQAVSTDAILRATARRYGEVRSLQAEFEQQIRNPLLGRTVTSRGTLYQRQPDRFLMRFSDPDGDIIVSDGDHFWIYYPSVDARQVIRTSGGGAQGLDLHAQFIGDPVSRFQATSHGQESVQGRTAHVLTLVPRQPMGYRSMKVWIDEQDHLVRRFELTEENGAVRSFLLSDLTVNPSLPDRLFQFTPPAGAQVIQR